MNDALPPYIPAAHPGVRSESPYAGRSHDGIKDTFESIIVALILAFVFRAFIVEAFVIPTGSMAPSLYGAHGTVVCEDCGTEFAYGLRDLDDPRQMQRVTRRTIAVCPNCNHPNTNLKISDDPANPERGDRILVLKWPLDVGVASLQPQRWDVTVFKDPADGVTNFIKRLVGLPNEALMILQGDVYTAPVAALSGAARDALEQNLEDKFALQHRQASSRLRPLAADILAELDQKMRIARKTEAAQSELWFDVYNHDHPPVRIDANQPQWIAAAGEKSGWDSTCRRLRFADKQINDDGIELINGNFQATAAYNVFEREAPPVSDHRLSFVLIPKSDTGQVHLRLGKLGRFFVATLGMDGNVAIAESTEPAPPLKAVRLSAKVEPFKPGEAVELAFENVDYRLSLSIDGEEVLASSSEPGSAGYYGPSLRGLRAMQLEFAPSPPRISAEGGSFELLHVLVQRDVHYFNDSRFNSLAGLPWAPREGWGSPSNPILLRNDEYFMLGDNTAASKDSRLWDQIGSHLLPRGQAVQLGAVPRDQLIGKAFFVYWPSGQRIEWLPILDRFGIIPDVGRMRWIR